MAKDVFIDVLSEPLNGATSAKFDINVGNGNLTIGRLSGDEDLLASGMLQHLRGQGAPTRTVALSNGRAILTLRAGQARQSWFRLPWSACNGATDWSIHLNPMVSSDINAHSDGGNVRLDLTSMAILSKVSADTGGGSIELILPDSVAGLSVTAKTGGGNVTVEVGRGTTGSNSVSAQSGAGNVTVVIPSGLAVRVRATRGLGKVVAPQLTKVDRHTCQSPDYDTAADRLDVTASSGAGNVTINTK